ncbi:hypothetical protein CMQ_1181 [Grosmannia clavigera kw1407]|uniref:Uncharacterized protein n=1 Tax=Grosmannia clavigera (strain kw1407 / UAMH 11150) TaxID=655863 RepID=F0XDL2_GROCL|nr:uncharacterized protein CMQ_1181 [Grosmannia clavigera kw1407]EFX04253.1 hypothetical protein CMQ_1181 [Grosmannia clavigera kw1407]
MNLPVYISDDCGNIEANQSSKPPSLAITVRLILHDGNCRRKTTPHVAHAFVQVDNRISTAAQTKGARNSATSLLRNAASSGALPPVGYSLSPAEAGLQCLASASSAFGRVCTGDLLEGTYSRDGALTTLVDEARNQTRLSTASLALQRLTAAGQLLLPTYSLNPVLDKLATFVATAATAAPDIAQLLVAAHALDSSCSTFITLADIRDTNVAAVQSTPAFGSRTVATSSVIMTPHPTIMPPRPPPHVRVTP